MKTALQYIFIALALFSASLLARAETQPTTGPRPEVSCRATAEVAAGRPVRLMDFATVSFVDSGPAQEALSTIIVDGPKENEKLHFKNAELVRMIKNKFAENPNLYTQKWTYFVPEQVELVGKKILMSSQAAENQIEWAVMSKCGDCKVNIKDLHIPPARDTRELVGCQLDLESLKVAGTFLLPVRCEDGQESKTYWISGSMRISKTAPVSLRQIAPGERFAAKDVRFEMTDVTFAKDGVPGETELVGQVAARWISVNQPIFRSDMKKELAVQRGQLVKATMGDDTFEVTTQAVAEDQGYIGDLIKVKSSDTQKVMSGLITEKGVVKIQ